MRVAETATSENVAGISRAISQSQLALPSCTSSCFSVVMTPAEPGSEGSWAVLRCTLHWYHFMLARLLF